MEYYHMEVFIVMILPIAAWFIVGKSHLEMVVSSKVI